MKVAIAAGGTGGHVYPAVAVANALLKQGNEVFWFGRPSSLEEREALQLGSHFVPMAVQGLKRKFTLENLKALLQFAKGRFAAKKHLRGIHPDVLFALGSYVSAPVISAALSLDIPVAVHEQNAAPGLVVEKFANKVSLVMLAQPLHDSKLNANSRIVGMPLRSEICLERSAAHYRDFGLDPEKKTLLIFGGSQGARAFIKLAVDLAKEWRTTRPDCQIFLQTGEKNFSADLNAGLSNLLTAPHIQQMGKAYACADVILARSGAVSCAEIEAARKPAILVPYPYATRNHQMFNALEHLKNNPGRMIPESQLNAGLIDQTFQAFLTANEGSLPEKKENHSIELIIESLKGIASRGRKA